MFAHQNHIFSNAVSYRMMGFNMKPTYRCWKLLCEPVLFRPSHSSWWWANKDAALSHRYRGAVMWNQLMTDEVNKLMTSHSKPHNLVSHLQAWKHWCRTKICCCILIQLFSNVDKFGLTQIGRYEHWFHNCLMVSFQLLQYKPANTTQLIVQKMRPQSFGLLFLNKPGHTTLILTLIS